MHVQGGIVVKIDGRGDAADGEVLDMRILAADDAECLGGLSLVVQASR